MGKGRCINSTVPLMPVAVRVRLMPAPRRFNDAVQIGIAGRPAQFAADLLARCNQNRRVPGAARRHLGWNRVPRNCARSLDDLPDGEPLPIAQVVGSAPLIQCAQRQNVRLRQVDNMDIVAHTGAVTRRVVVAKDLDTGAFALAT